MFVDARQPHRVARIGDRIVPSSPAARRNGLFMCPPSWSELPERQLERASQLWPNVSLPEPPSFVQRTASEALLLHIPRPIDELWENVVPPAGCHKHVLHYFETGEGHLRLAKHVTRYAEPVWLGFDPEHGRGECPGKFRNSSDVAATEVLSAMIQFPKWPLAWREGASSPNLTGLEFNFDSCWTSVPFLYMDREQSELFLSVHFEYYPYEGWASPSIREC